MCITARADSLLLLCFPFLSFDVSKGFLMLFDLDQVRSCGTALNVS